MDSQPAAPPPSPSSATAASAADAEAGDDGGSQPSQPLTVYELLCDNFDEPAVKKWARLRTNPDSYEDAVMQYPDVELMYMSLTGRDLEAREGGDDDY